ncbi:MAG: hypothetical protein DSO03_04650 [Hadesarchaea archaeon]|nr:MAG: hypothetical protein DSO03_04650 [Hadesarchaea archaeon]
MRKVRKMKVWRMWSGEFSFPCPECGKEVGKEKLRWLVERILLDANPGMLEEMRAGRKGEEYFSWLVGLYTGKISLFCPVCTAGLSDDLVRYLIDRILVGSNPELLVRVKAKWKAEEGKSVLENLYFGREYTLSCDHCFREIGGEAIRHLVEQILEEANPGLLEELRRRLK